MSCGCDSSREFDLVIVGAGPAGLAGAYAAKKKGLVYVVLERGEIAQTVTEYPLNKPLHSPAPDVELLCGELNCLHFPTREEVLNHYRDFALRRHHLHIHTHESVAELVRGRDFIGVQSDRSCYKARHVLLAIGGFGCPRTLRVPGESAERVSYKFREGAPFAGLDVLVVGGGNSAAEAALHLYDAGARVVLSLRRPSLAPREGKEDPFMSVKAFNRKRLGELECSGVLRIFYSSRVVNITPTSAELILEKGAQKIAVPCVRIFALLGGNPDVSLLEKMGGEIAPDGRPVYDPETFETTVPRIYVAGHITRQLHMSNAITFAPRIVFGIAAQKKAALPRVGEARVIFLEVAQMLRTKSSKIRSLLARPGWFQRVVQDIDLANKVSPPSGNRFLRVRQFIRLR